MESAQIDAMNRTKTVGPWRDPKYGRNVNNRTALRTQASVMYFNGTAIT
jgi:hypothetical protein